VIETATETETADVTEENRRVATGGSENVRTETTIEGRTEGAIGRRRDATVATKEEARGAGVGTPMTRTTTDVEIEKTDIEGTAKGRTQKVAGKDREVGYQCHKNFISSPLTVRRKLASEFFFSGNYFQLKVCA